MKFKYSKSLGGNYFPIVPIRLHFKNKFFDTTALIDSGATTSVMQEVVAKNLDITIENGKEIILGGVGGKIKGYLRKITLEVTPNVKFDIPVIFSHEYLVSFNLLGRNAFFEKYKITFDEKNKHVELV